jgi:hypothetical protein
MLELQPSARGTLMAHYCGVDLGARHSHLCVIDDQQSILLNKRVPNDMRVRE